MVSWLLRALKRYDGEKIMFDQSNNIKGIYGHSDLRPLHYLASLLNLNWLEQIKGGLDFGLSGLNRFIGVGLNVSFPWKYFGIELEGKVRNGLGSSVVSWMS